MQNVSHLVRDLPSGMKATLRGTELTIGGMHVDLRTLLHECGAVGHMKTHTFPPDHAQYPRLTVTLATRNGGYTSILRNGNGSYTAVAPGKVPISTHPTAGDAAVARAVYQNKHHKRKAVEDDDDESLASSPKKKQSGKHRLLQTQEELQHGHADGHAADDGVLFVKERTREQRDAEGRANAMVVM